MHSKRLKKVLCLILISFFSIQSITYASTNLVTDLNFDSLIKEHCKQAQILKSQSALETDKGNCCDHQSAAVIHCGSCFANLFSLLTTTSCLVAQQSSAFAPINKLTQIYSQPTLELFKPPI